MKAHLYVAGALHFAILIASALVPRVLDWRANLAKLHPFLRDLFWVYGSFIVVVIIGFGTITLLNAAELAAGDPLARGVSAFISVFWLARLVVQLWVFDAEPFLTTPLLRLGYHALTFIFVYLTAVYGIAAFPSIHL